MLLPFYVYSLSVDATADSMDGSGLSDIYIPVEQEVGYNLSVSLWILIRRILQYPVLG